MFTQKHIKGQLTAALAGSTMLVAVAAQADQQILDDLIVDGSACVGFDCVNGESFGFDTIRMKENNVRLHFDDTSNSASFPQNDWRILANDTSNGGSNYMAIEDSTAGRQIFRVDAGAPANSLRVDSGGDVGVGVSNPVVELHVVDGDSPTLRLEQNGSSGFTPQTFDLVSNEANFFIRDVTNGSQLPFRIKPGADTDALFIAANNNVGVGTDSPSASLEVNSTENLTAGSPQLLVRNDNANAANRRMIGVSNNGGAFIHMENRQSGAIWAIVNANTGTDFLINDPASAGAELILSQAGDLTIKGGLISTGAGGACTVADPCDAVFDPEVYTVPSIEDHADQMWANQYLPAVGPTTADMPVNVTEKMLRILNELEHAHIYIEQLHHRIEKLEKTVEG